MTVTCTKTLMEVSVEIYGPFDVHRWVKIGKKREDMLPLDVSISQTTDERYHVVCPGNKHFISMGPE